MKFFTDEEAQQAMADGRILACARLTHEANRAWCILHGDESQHMWDWAPDWQRLSAVKGVLGVLAGNSPEESHLGWLKEKQEKGWIYGLVKDPDAVPPTHPAMVAYADLPVHQLKKDQIFVGTCMVMAIACDLPIKQLMDAIAKSKDDEAANQVEGQDGLDV